MAKIYFDNYPDKFMTIKFPQVVQQTTNLVIYGSGFLEPGSAGLPGSHDAGDSFKKVAEARHKINKTKKPKSINKLHYCPTDIEFFDIINNAKEISRLDIYCHGWLHGINLGGFTGKRNVGGKLLDGDKIDWMNNKHDQGKDLRRVEIHENFYLQSAETTELYHLDANAFSANPEIYFWGCNIGGQLDLKGNHIANNDPYIKDPKESFAQKFAEEIGRGNVYTLVGKGNAGGSMFKTNKSGKPVFHDGEMLPANISANNKHINTIMISAKRYLKKFPL